MENSDDSKCGLRRKPDDLPLAVDNQPDGNRLHAPCGKGWLHLLPQHRRKFKTHQTVEYAPRLLRIDQVKVYSARGFNGPEDSRFRDFMKHDTLGLFFIQAQRFVKVP